MSFRNCVLYFVDYVNTRPFLFTFYWILYAVFNSMQSVFISLLWLYNPPYETQVCVKKVITRFRPVPWFNCFQRIDFITLYQKFESKNVLFDEDIHLYGFDERGFYFVKTPSVIDPYDSKNYVFISQALFENAVTFYEISFKTMQSLCNKIERQGKPIILLLHTGRCGSTLLANIFNETKKAWSLSHPDIFTCFQANRDEHYFLDNFETIVKCSLLYLLRSTKWNCKSSVIFIKPRSDFTPMYRSIRNVLEFPHLKPLFLYRNGLDTIHSFQNADFRAFKPDIYFRFPVLNRFRIMENKVRYLITMDLNDAVLYSAFTIRTAVWASKMKAYIDLSASDSSVGATTYEDIVKGKCQCIKSIFAYCGLDPELALLGVKALGYHSQKGLYQIRRDKSTPYEGKDKVYADTICDEMNVQRLNERVVFPTNLKY